MELFLVFTICIVGLASFRFPLTSAAQLTYCVVSEHARTGEAHRSTSFGATKTKTYCTENKTWNEYLAQQNRYFHAVSNVTFLFYSGTHYMNRSLEAKNISNLLLSGNSPHDVILTSSVHGVSTPLNFTNFSNITVEGMSIELCASVRMNEAVNKGLLYFSSGGNVTLYEINYKNACNGCLIFGENIRNITFSHINITNSNPSVCGDVCLTTAVSGNISIIHSAFSTPSADLNCDSSVPFLNFGPNLIENTSIHINHSSFNCRNVLIINIASTSRLLMNNVTANGCIRELGSHCASAQGTFSIRGPNGILYISNSTFEYCVSAIIADNVSVAIFNSTFSNNVGILSEAWNNASALSIYGNRNNVLSSVKFHGNGRQLTSYKIPNSPVLLINESSISITNCMFEFGFGNALYSHLSNLSFIGYIFFNGNVGYEGAAMYLHVDDSTNIEYEKSTIDFKFNLAFYTGGAIQMVGVNADAPICPFKYSKNMSNSSGLSFFNNNGAGTAGDDIYGGYLDQAHHKGNDTRRCIEFIRQTSQLSSYTMSSISSNPSRVCLCTYNNSLHRFEPNCLKVFSTREAYPGENINFSVVAVGQTFGTSTGFINAQLLELNNSASSHLDDQQQYQVVGHKSCNNITYTIQSHPGLVILVLTTNNMLIQSYGDVKVVEENIKIYNKNNHSYVPKPLLSFPVYINVTLKPCPPGFNLSLSSHKCVCAQKILDIGVNCHISKRQLERSGTVWIGNNNSVVSFSKYCPYNYCKSATVNIFHNPDLQCQMDHVGRLCGECRAGKSLTLGRSHCKKCSNSNLYLLVPFAASGVILVVFLKLSDLTTAGGLINGLVLYANLVKAGCYTYFPRGYAHLEFLRVFIDWLNLDLGIETCFFDGLTGYWKTWLQFVFPLYIWAIALSMILLARYSFRMAHLLGNNSVPVLTTLFLLSYAKLLRVITTAMKFTILKDEYGNNTTSVWSYDGSIDYFSQQHLVLLIAAVLVLLFLWLPYTSVLLLVQFLNQCCMGKITRFVSRMQPFIDAHCGPFKHRHRYWFGLLLVARAVPLLVGTISSTNSEINTILSTIVVVGFLFILQSRVYRKLYVSVSESIFLTNLLLLAGSNLYTLSIGSDQQGVFMSVLVGFAFLHFLTIAIFSTARHFKIACGLRQWIPLQINVNDDLDILSYQQNRSDI